MNDKQKHKSFLSDPVKFLVFNTCKLEIEWHEEITWTITFAKISEI